jgi:FKBP-type peptidyl-prolyl cis-trans isomerase (trigger factor)
VHVNILSKDVAVLAVRERIEEKDPAQDGRVAVVEGVGGADGAEVPGARKKERVRRISSGRFPVNSHCRPH